MARLITAPGMLPRGINRIQVIGDLGGHIHALMGDYRRGIILRLLRLGEEWMDRDQIARMNIEIVTGTGIAITSRQGREGVEALV